MIDKNKLAETVYTLLLDKPERYRNFGVYWYLVKELLKRFYDRDRLYLLGDYRDESVIRRMPEHPNLDDALAAAMATYNENAAYAMGGNRFEDKDGDVFVLYDPDAGK